MKIKLIISCIQNFKKIVFCDPLSEVMEEYNSQNGKINQKEAYTASKEQGIPWVMGRAAQYGNRVPGLFKKEPV